MLDGLNMNELASLLAYIAAIAAYFGLIGLHVVRSTPVEQEGDDSQ